MIDTDKYPRVTFRIDLKLNRHISFADPFRKKDLWSIRRQCLEVDNLAASQAVGRYIEASGVQAIVYPSVACTGKNVVAFTLLVLREKVIRPLLAGSSHPASQPKILNSTPLDNHYQQIRASMRGLFRKLGVAA